MRVTPYDPENPTVVFTPFRTIPLGPDRELRIDLSAKGASRAVSVRLWKSKGRGRPLAPEFPWHLFPRDLAGVIEALTEASAAIAAAPATPAEQEPRPCP